jgi:hypothetical protein
VEDENRIYTYNPALGGWVTLGTIIDHGSLQGLSLDHHTQYSLVSGARAFTGPVGGVTPVAASDLATKGYVDNRDALYLPLAGGTMTGNIVMPEDGVIGITGAQVIFDGSAGCVRIPGALAIREGGAAPTFYTVLQGGDQTADVVYTLPSADGTAGQVLSTNGAGMLSWVTAGVSWPVLAPDGTAAAPSYSFTNDPDMGIYRGGVDIFKLVTAGVDRVTILANGNVGIGTSSPRTRMELGNDGAILAIGTYGSGWTEPSLGAGTRMLWYPRKAAFRAGYANGNMWNDAYIGSYSVAFGNETIASAFGTFAMGYQAQAIGNYAAAFGNNTTASGDYSFATGHGTTASGLYSFATGHGTTASGLYSFATGHSTIASGSWSIALNDNTTASGYRATAIGEYTTAQAYDSLVIGRYNIISGTPNAWVATDPLFVIGNGTDASNRANAVTVLKNGNIGIATASPTAYLDVNSDIFRLRTAKTPATATAPGNTGDICWDANYIYVCVAANTWKRAVLATW